jgi:hypothetical protein
VLLSFPHLAPGRYSLPVDALAELEEVVRTLAAIPERESASPGEREAACWLAERFEEHGCEVAVEEGAAHGTYWWPMGLSAALGAAAGIASAKGRRLAGAVGGAAAAALLVDDVASGPRLLRRMLPKKTCWNVVAVTGDASARDTVVVMAHHDAPHTGRIFDQSAQAWLARRFPSLLDRVKTAPPLYWPVLAGPLAVALGSLLRKKWMTVLGTVASATSAAVFADVGMSPVNQGANDDLSGVAGLVWVARALRERPVSGIRVVLASCGAEESYQEGIRAFMARHKGELPVGRTWFVNLETVGSPRLLLLEGEGPVVMRDYESSFKDLVESCAKDEGIPLERGFRARTTTDSLVTARGGYPTATLTSINEIKALSNYHLMSDVPDNLNWSTVADAARLAEAVVRRLAAGGSTVSSGTA